MLNAQRSRFCRFHFPFAIFSFFIPGMSYSHFTFHLIVIHSTVTYAYTIYCNLILLIASADGGGSAKRKCKDIRWYPVKKIEIG